MRALRPDALGRTAWMLLLAGALFWASQASAAPTSVPSRSAQAASADGPGFLGPVDRIGVRGMLYGDAAHLSGEQSINQFRNDESFDFGAGGLALSAYLLFQKSDHFRWGPEVRFLGSYGSTSGNAFTFGTLSEIAANVEYSLRVVELVDAVFAVRGGLALLFIGGSFADEVRRLQAQGTHVGSLPRPGVFGGLSIGARRPIVGALAARLEFFGELEHLFLISDDENVSGLHFQKSWSADARRLGLTLGLEVGF